MFRVDASVIKVKVCIMLCVFEHEEGLKKKYRALFVACDDLKIRVDTKCAHPEKST